MIIGIVLGEMLTKINSCSVKLYLTGSRHFGENTNDSDFDFFCENTGENQKVIASLGKWTKEEMTIDSVLYNDLNTSDVWFHYEIGQPSIHVQFVHDVQKKANVQDFLQNFPFNKIGKKERKHIWNWAYRAIERMQKA